MNSSSESRVPRKARGGQATRRGTFLRLLVLLVSTLPFLLGANNGTLTFYWDANTETTLAGYYLYWGTQSGSYTQPRVMISKTLTTYTLTGLDPNLTYYAALTAFDIAGNESDFSNEASGQPIAAVCGDGTRDPNEGCDDGGTVAGDGCSPICQVEICSNGILDPGEGCDDGNSTSGDGCSSTCQLEGCGNGVVDSGEQCDDGNTSGGDGCSSTCRREVCGNAIVDPGEACDDGNTTSGDLCSATCQREICGNGVLDANEQCDDGNTSGGDGCSSTCRREICGNRTIDPGETCDDGNTTSGDGCSSTCRVELASPLVSGALDVTTGKPYLMRCSLQTIKVTGSNFRSGAAVSFVDTSITVPSTQFVSSTELRAVVRASSSTTLGGKTLRVTNTDGSSGTVTGSASVEVVKNPDFSRNGKVGAEDFNELAIAFGSVLGGLNFNSDVDMNGDNLVDGKDLNRFAPYLGWTVTSCP